MKTKFSKRSFYSFIINFVLGIICLLWIIPTFGLFISSFRNAMDIKTTGWWTIFPHKEWVTIQEINDLPRDIASDVPFSIEGIDGVTATYSNWKNGIITSDGKLVKWPGNKKLNNAVVQEKKWVWKGKNLTLDNYKIVLGGKSYVLKNSDGTKETVEGEGLMLSFLNSIAVAFPSAIIPILIAAFTAYGLSWIKFKGRKFLLVLITALLVVPYQVALVPMLRDFTKVGIGGSFLAAWLAHTTFSLPLVVYYSYNAISSLPREMLESAFIDGASHYKVFYHLVLPTTIPTLASFTIFQFVWTWNDYFVNLIFLGDKNTVLTKSLADMIGSRGSDWHLLTSGAFISMLLPLVIFFSLQKYYVRGLLAGAVKG